MSSETGVSRLVWYQARRLTLLKIALAGTTTFGVSYVVSDFVLHLGPLAGLWLFAVVPLTPAPALFVLGLVEQRLPVHLITAAACVLCALVPPWIFMANVPADELRTLLAIYVPLTWLLGMLGSLGGIAAGRARYTIAFGQRGTCTGCGHDLRSLTENQCPQCGRSFDPRQHRIVPADGGRTPSSGSDAPE